MASLQSLLDTLATTAKPTERLPLLHCAADRLYRANPEQALEFAREAEQLAHDQQDPVMLAKSLHLIGFCHQQRSDLVAAKQAFEAGLELTQALNEPALRVNILRGLLQTAFRSGRVQEALERGLQALELAQSVDDVALRAITHNDLGIIYGHLHALNSALEHFTASLELLEQTDKPDLSKTLNNLGELYMQLDKPEQALGYFERSVEAFRAKQDQQGEGIALGNIGRAHLSQGDARRALEYFEASRERFEALKDSPYLAASYTKIGQAYTSLMDYPQARWAFEQALTLQRDQQQSFINETLYSLSKLLIQQGTFDEALGVLHQALTVAEKSGVKSDQYGVHRLLSQAYEGLGNLELALIHFKRFHELREAVRDEANESRVNALMVQFETEQLRQERDASERRHSELQEAYDQLQVLNEKLEAQSQMLERLSREDVLTRLYNRRFFDQQLSQELRRAKRYNQPLSVALIDLDSFKEINDTLSHQVGDLVLQEIAGILRRTTRDSDTAARYGGEEFAVVFPGIGLEQAARACEKIRRAVAGHAWDAVHPGLQVTLSIGVSERTASSTSDTLLADADRELYIAKRAGKNQVMPVFSPRFAAS